MLSKQLIFQDLIASEEQTFRTLLDSLGIYQNIDSDTQNKCLETIRLFKARNGYNCGLNDVDDDSIMDEEKWEETKDVLFMLRVPFEIELTEESREKFSKAVMKRHRKRGRYGPQGGFSVS